MLLSFQYNNSISICRKSASPKRRFILRAPPPHSARPDVPELQKCERTMSRGAMVGIASAFAGEQILPDHPGIVNQLALELHTQPIIAYFTIVFLGAYMLDRAVKRTTGDVRDIWPHLSSVEHSELYIGRCCMVLFVLFFALGVNMADGLTGEPGPLAQIMYFI